MYLILQSSAQSLQYLIGMSQIHLIFAPYFLKIVAFVQGPPITGDPILEQCDGTDSSNICRNAGEQFRGNTLSCTNACYFDSSNCMECSDSQHVQCSYESPQYQAGTIYSDKVSSDYICRNDGTGWAWRSHSEGLGAIQNTVREQCGNGIDTNCNAHLHFARNGNTLNLHRYIGDSQGEFNVIPDIDAFDPHCFSNVTGVVNVDGSPLANATISLFIRDINNNDQLFRKINSSNDGTFSFDPNGIPSTEYKIVVSKEGYFSQVKLINLTYESQNNFEFDLLSGSCQSDCTRGDGFCHANCDGIAGCSFKEGTKQEFDLVQQGIYRIVDNEYYLTCDTHEPNPSFALTAQLEDNVQCEDGKTLSVDKRIVLFNGEPAEVLIYVCR